jgi:mono/diheme cytochrome c family protein
MALSLAACGSTSGSGPEAPQPQPPGGRAASVSSDAAAGPYTAEQAERGRAAFRDACERCHEAARFSTADFFRVWTRAPLSQLYGFLVTNMPRGAPGSLTRPEYADIVAYLLSLNGILPGSTDLPPSTAALAQIRIGAPPR